MKKKNMYSHDFKLQVVKEYFNSDLSLTDIASKFVILDGLNCTLILDITTIFSILKKADLNLLFLIFLKSILSFMNLLIIISNSNDSFLLKEARTFFSL